jgi:twinkle protein
MKYQSSNTKNIIDIDWGNRKAKHICPECSHTRKNSKEKCLEYYPETDSAYCFHCNTTFFRYDPHKIKKQYAIPEWKNTTDLTDKAVRYFTGRKISQDTLKHFKIYSDTEWMPQLNKKVETICIPYFRDGKLINIKFRGPNKSFKLVSNAELIFWNIDALNNSDEIVIVEGEIDTLSYYQVGIKNVISVPNGANKNLEYLDSCIELFEGIQTVYLGVDQDIKGIALRDELARRIGQEKCKIVSFRNCKDANEYLLQYGGIELQETIKNAKLFPIKGVVTAADFYNNSLALFENGIQPGKSIGVPEIDQYVTWETGRLATVTGIPGCGKSEFVDFLVTKLNLKYGWKVAYFTPENYPLQLHFSKLFEKLIGKKFNRANASLIDFDLAYEHIKDNVFWIMDEDDMTVDSVLATGKSYVKNKGIKILVIDPYNRLDHKYNDTETQYISRFLDKITSFARFNNVLVFLVAHPVKMGKDIAGKTEVPTLYNISGSANFYNKTDYGFTVHRDTDSNNLMQNSIKVYWQKIKFKHLGQQGISQLLYNYNNGRFEAPTGDSHSWDNTCWLITKNNTQVKDEDIWKATNEKAPF